MEKKGERCITMYFCVQNAYLLLTLQFSFVLELILVLKFQKKYLWKINSTEESNETSEAIW